MKYDYTIVFDQSTAHGVSLYKRRLARTTALPVNRCKNEKVIRVLFSLSLHYIHPKPVFLLHSTAPHDMIPVIYYFFFAARFYKTKEQKAIVPGKALSTKFILPASVFDIVLLYNNIYIALDRYYPKTERGCTPAIKL